MARDNGLDVDAATEVAITVGATGAYAATCMALLDPGDGILLLEPYYGYHLNAAIVAGLEPQFLRARGARVPDRRGGARGRVTPRTRARSSCARRRTRPGAC